MSERSYDYRDYQVGHYDGKNDSIREKHEAAYFTGVGYGKKQAGDTNIGFSSADELASFEYGVKNKDKHYKCVNKKLNFFDRLLSFFGFGKQSYNKTFDCKKKRNKYVKGRKKVNKRRRYKR